MNICEELAAGFMTGFLISAGHEPTLANPQSDGMMATSETARQFIVLFGTLTPDIARKLSAHLKSTRDVGAASRPSTTCVCSEEGARSHRKGPRGR
jgi:hypothetical protein